MKINLHPVYHKHYKKRIIPHSNLDKKAAERIKIFILDPHHPILKDHQLSGAKRHLRAFWITGNIRITYKVFSTDEVEFMDIGTHNQVY
ncbi:MAG: Plasmid stabilization system [Candidatus Amesbacteria bacterium GW2011_GWA1_47_20]|uniref:Plasmid stabilization system n=2 Tax=Candidatus Amesiibacteriota TaxID=1752730 RepID=A0A0G1SK76_9BACT|nr:MAG: Plasmid stabilization system [Candidatus Amesbacteria bacterium GW2011_GWA1_47_20]KKU84013.1 MAG: Plasmid stabilization system [Candidatus Amesbacteria bacterium GW2011_GWC2_47_8]